MIKVVFLAGPTASGKTEYAVKLARDLGGEIVSADSMQIYKYMDIGSAKPTPEERAAARHWLVDEVDPRSPFSVYMYQQRARECIQEIASRGLLPIVCGGTGLYLSSLIYDMDFSAPGGSAGRREAIMNRDNGSARELHERLARLDPEAAAQIHPNNVKRVVRALERLEGGEERISRFSGVTALYPGYDPVLAVLSRSREELYERIDRRVDRLMEAGLADEVRSLMAMGFTSDDIAMKGIGYKELIDAFNAGTSLSDAAEVIKLNTRHYAKRQLTWLRSYPFAEWFTVTGAGIDKAAYEKLLGYIKERL